MAEYKAVPHASAGKIWLPQGVCVSAALPYRMISRKLNFLIRNSLGLEVVLYDTDWICNYSGDKVQEIAHRLWDGGVDVSAHGPVHDLNAGSLDVVIRDYTRHCYFKTLAICHALGAKNLVLHLGLNPLLPESALDKWLFHSVRTWTPIVEMAEQLRITIALENMFIPDPQYLIALKEQLRSDIVRYCFDIGHYHAFSKVPLSNWLDELGTDIVEVHLNDNMGSEDEHLALGKGSIDFRRFFRELATRKIMPRFVIEMTSEKFEESLDYLARNDLLSAFSFE
ncbi:MAG: sugar phosphate isomerase/epimerase [Candidatus Abyssubacteria bacterium]